MKDHILGIITDDIADFLYYDRKEDPRMSPDDIERAFKEGAITVDEAVECFREALIKGLG